MKLTFHIIQLSETNDKCAEGYVCKVSSKPLF